MFRRKESNDGAARSLGDQSLTESLGVTTLALDPTLGNTRLRKALAAALAGNIEAISSIVHSAPSWDEQAFLIDRLTQEGANAAVAHQWAAIASSDAVAATMNGASLIAQAWVARTSAASRDVSQEQFDRFHALLRSAEAELDRAIRLNPTSPLPWWPLLASARGLQISKVEARWRHGEMCRRDPLLYLGHEHFIATLAPKWSGGETDAFDAARQITAGLEAGSPLHALIIHAHMECMPGDISAADYFSESSIRAEALHAIAQTVEHPDFPTSLENPAANWARNWCLFASLALGNRDEARRQFEALENRFTTTPWVYWGGDIMAGVHSLVSWMPPPGNVPG